MRESPAGLLPPCQACHYYRWRVVFCPSVQPAMPKHEPDSGQDPARYEKDYSYLRDEYRLYGRYAAHPASSHACWGGCHLDSAVLTL
eukprot:COSAG02_NODE_2338_length_9108_cov_17.856699_7_plen_86_part_01